VQEWNTCLGNKFVESPNWRT